MSITLPHEMVADVKKRVASGEYASESEVIRDALRALNARDRAVHEWLHAQVPQAYDALNADPLRGQTADQVRAALRRECE